MILFICEFLCVESEFSVVLLISFCVGGKRYTLALLFDSFGLKLYVEFALDRFYCIVASGSRNQVHFKDRMGG